MVDRMRSGKNGPVIIAVGKKKIRIETKLIILKLENIKLFFIVFDIIIIKYFYQIRVANIR